MGVLQGVREFSFSLIFIELFSDFIIGLERDYPSTVSTIARTCAKVVPKFEADGRCELCNRFVDF